MTTKKLETSIEKKYRKDVIPEIKKTYKLKNKMECPKIEKVVINMGLNKAKDDSTVMEEAKKHLAQITGQKPVVTKARKAISNFGIKKGTPIGCMVTLRGEMMNSFLERLLRVVLPRIRDFGGIKKSLDRFGNLTIGLEDESIFPEINPDTVKHIKGMGITIVTDKHDRDKSEKMFELLGFPFK